MAYLDIFDDGLDAHHVFELEGQVWVFFGVGLVELVLFQLQNKSRAQADVPKGRESAELHRVAREAF